MKKVVVILILGFLSEQISIKSPISGNQTLNNLAVANNNNRPTTKMQADAKTTNHLILLPPPSNFFF